MNEDYASAIAVLQTRVGNHDADMNQMRAQHAAEMAQMRSLISQLVDELRHVNQRLDVFTGWVKGIGTVSIILAVIIGGAQILDIVKGAQ